MPLGFLFFFTMQIFTKVLESFMLKLKLGDFSFKMFSYLFGSESCSVVTVCTAFALICFNPKHDSSINI